MFGDEARTLNDVGGEQSWLDGLSEVVDAKTEAIGKNEQKINQMKIQIEQEPAPMKDLDPFGFEKNSEILGAPY